MSTLGTNIIANFFGGAWIAVLTVVITPLQVHILGIEAYGLVSLISVLQIALSALDLGLSATMTKVVSADRSEKFAASRELINSCATLYWGMALMIAVLLLFNSAWIAAHWLKASTIDAETVALGIQIIAVYLALRWPVSFYAGLINGLQRMDLLNLIRSGMASLRLAGGVIVILALPKLEAFLIWFAISAALELAAYAIVVRRLIPGLALRPYFSFVTVKRIWTFSAAMSLIALTSMLLTQLDRMILSKLLSLEALGYYSLAYNTAIGISLLQSAINTASFPAFSGAHSRAQTSELLMRYDKTSQLMGYVVAFPCFVLVFFGHDILRLWISTTAADGASFAMALLALGFFLNGMVSNAYLIAVACGRPYLPLKVNLVGLLLYVPGLYWLISETGINGAAACWTALNLYYLFTLFPLVQIGLLRQESGPWLKRNFFPFLLAGLVTFGSMKALATAVPYGWASWPALGAAAVTYALIGYMLLSAGLRADIRTLAGKVGIPLPGETR